MAEENTPQPQSHGPSSGGMRSSGPGGGGPGGPGGGRPGGPAKPGKRNFGGKKKVCRFCVDKSDYIDYKKAEILAPFIQERGKILPRRMTGTCSRHQRWLPVAINRAQNIASLPFAGELKLANRYTGREQTLVEGIVAAGRKAKLPARRRRDI